MTTQAEPSYRQRLGYHAGVLGGICCIVSLLLIIGNMETSERIATHIAAEQRATLAEVLPASLYDNQPLDTASQLELTADLTSAPTLFIATKNQTFSGAALQTSVYGWGSDIQFIVAINEKGEITGVRVIDHKETPGLADKIEVSKDDWILGFNGKSLANTAKNDWAVKKDGGDIDQFTGATITPRALVKGIYQALALLDQQRLDQQRLKAQEKAP